MATDPRKLPPVRLRSFTANDTKRMKEALFFYIVSQVKASTKATALPMQVSVPEMLAYLTNTNPGVLGHAFNVLDLTANRPTTLELMVASKWLELPSSKVPRTKDTFYKLLGEYRELGQKEFIPRLSDIQHVEIKKFLSRYGDTFLGNKDTSVHISRAVKGVI